MMDHKLLELYQSVPRPCSLVALHLPEYTWQLGVDWLPPEKNVSSCDQRILTGKQLVDLYTGSVKGGSQIQLLYYFRVTPLFMQDDFLGGHLRVNRKVTIKSHPIINTEVTPRKLIL